MTTAVLSARGSNPTVATLFIGLLLTAECRAPREGAAACTRKPWRWAYRWRRGPSRGYDRLHDSRGRDRGRCWDRPRECRVRAAFCRSRALRLREPSSGRGRRLVVATPDAPATWRPHPGA